MTEATTKKNDDTIAKLAGRGEEALQRLVALPGGKTAVRAYSDLRTRVDDLSKRVRGVEELEQRLAKLEKEVAALKRAQKEAAPKAPSRKAASS